jgi:hypothetical protein
MDWVDRLLPVRPARSRWSSAGAFAEVTAILQTAPRLAIRDDAPVFAHRATGATSSASRRGIRQRTAAHGVAALEGAQTRFDLGRAERPRTNPPASGRRLFRRATPATAEAIDQLLRSTPTSSAAASREALAPKTAVILKRSRLASFRPDSGCGRVGADAVCDCNTTLTKRR